MPYFSAYERAPAVAFQVTHFYTVWPYNNRRCLIAVAVAAARVEMRRAERHGGRSLRQ